MKYIVKDERRLNTHCIILHIVSGLFYSWSVITWFTLFNKQICTVSYNTRISKNPAPHDTITVYWPWGLTPAPPGVRQLGQSMALFRFSTSFFSLDRRSRSYNSNLSMLFLNLCHHNSKLRTSYDLPCLMKKIKNE